MRTKWGTNIVGMHSKKEIRREERKRERAGKASQVRTARRASELTQRPPTITESIDQLGDLVAAHRSCVLPRRPRF